jgi:hypothetical protein
VRGFKFGRWLEAGVTQSRDSSSSRYSLQPSRSAFAFPPRRNSCRPQPGSDPPESVIDPQTYAQRARFDDPLPGPELFSGSRLSGAKTGFGPTQSDGRR